MALYHSELGLPENTKSYFGRKFKLNYSNHAKQAAISDRYGVISKPPFSIEITKDNIIEVETDENKVIRKLVIRIPYDGQTDLALAIIPDYSQALVKSCWLNKKSDAHSTLRTELYQKVS